MKYFISGKTILSCFDFSGAHLSKQQNIPYISCIFVLNIHHVEQKAKQ